MTWIKRSDLEAVQRVHASQRNPQGDRFNELLAQAYAWASERQVLQSKEDKKEEA